MHPLTVVLVEDIPDYRDRLWRHLAAAPSLQVVGCYSTGHDALAGIKAQQPDVALIDLVLPDMPGEEIIRQVQGMRKTECLVLTAYADDTRLWRAIQAGAMGYILKSRASPDQIIAAIHELRQGEAPMTGEIARRLLHFFQEVPHAPGAVSSPALHHLTPREKEILQFLARGFTSGKVARTLHITYHTVRTHQKHLYQKLGVASAGEAVAKFWGAT